MGVKGKWRQFGFALIATSALVSAGAVIGWSVEVGKLEDGESAFNVTLEQGEWLVASVGLASIFSSLVSGWVIEALGPCRLIQVMLLPTAIAWVVMATANSYAWLIVGRVVTGGFVQCAVVAIQSIVAELSEPGIRGCLSCLPEFGFSLGILIMYTFARFLTWQQGTLITGVMVLPVAALYLYLPESPYWYIRKGRFNEALRSLRKLRSSGHDVDSELRSIKEVVVDSRGMRGTFMEQIYSLKEPANYRPTILLASLFTLRECGGALVLFSYSPFFFETAGVPIDPFTATVLLGITRLLFNLVSAFLIDLVGRRALLINSSLVCAFMMMFTGLVLHFQYSPLSWLPLLSTIIFVAFYGLGPGPIPWVLLGEILPTPVRSVASSICTVLFCTIYYLETLFFPHLLAQFGLPTLVFVFAFFNGVSALTAWLFLPESRNRSLEDLQTAFVGAALRPFKKQREGYLQPYGATFSDKTKLLAK